MRIQEIKKNLKKTSYGNYYIAIQRKLGIPLTWLIINIFPKVTPNFLTFIMLPLNIVSCYLLYLGLLSSSLCLLGWSFFIFFFSEVIDCIDGNVARLKKQTSTFGQIIDRIVHNISFPMMFLVSGIAISEFSNSPHLIYVLFFLAAIYSELSPIETSIKQVMVSIIKKRFPRKSENKTTQNDSFFEKPESDNKNKNTSSMKKNKSSILMRLIKTFMAYESFFIVAILDILLLEKHNYILTKGFTAVFLVARVIYDFISFEDYADYLKN